MERSEDPALSDIVEIDQEIAAADQVQSRERRIAAHVLTREEAEIANVLRNPVLAVLADEKASEAFRRHFVHAAVSVAVGLAMSHCSGAFTTPSPQTGVHAMPARAHL